MEPILAAVGLVAAGWVVWKTGCAIRTLRAQRRDSDSLGGGRGSSASIGGLTGGASSGDSGHSGDCGGHGHGGSGGHGGW